MPSSTGSPPIVDAATPAAGYSDPLEQALVLTAIVISFGMTAVVVMIGLGAFLGSDDDHVDDRPALPEDTSEGTS